MRCLAVRVSAATLLSLVAALAAGCPGPTPAGVDARSAPVCVANTTQVCVCPLGVQGAQTCNAAGDGWLECRCGSTDGGTGNDHTAPVDGARADAAPIDSGRDAGAARDAALSDQRRPDLGVADAVAVDRAASDAGATDRVATLDARQPDRAGVDVDCGTACDAASGVDRLGLFDANWRVDSSGIDTLGMAGIGQPCDSQACVPGSTCLGGSSEGYFCRKDCELGGTDCDQQTERCVWFTYNDGGMAPHGGCEPAVGYSQPCWWDGGSAFCAEVYVCISPSGVFDYRCRARCLPGAVDAGCPVDSPRCASIRDMDGGACLPRG